MRFLIFFCLLLAVPIFSQDLTLRQASDEIKLARYPFTTLLAKLDSIQSELGNQLANNQFFISNLANTMTSDPDFITNLASATSLLASQDFIHAQTRAMDSALDVGSGTYKIYDIQAITGFPELASKTFASGANTFKVFRNGVLMRRGPSEDYEEISSTTIQFNYPLLALDNLIFKEERRQLNTGTLLDRYLVSIEGVQNPGGNIDLEDLAGNLDIIANDTLNKIQLRVKSPGSINSVQTNGGNLNLVASGSIIQVINNDLTDTISLKVIPIINSSNANLTFAIDPLSGIATASLLTVDSLNTFQGAVKLLPLLGTQLIEDPGSKTISIGLDSDSLFTPLLHESFVANGVQTDFILPGIASFTNDKTLKVFKNGVFQQGYTAGDNGDYYEVGSQTVRFFQPPATGTKVVLRVEHGIGQGAAGGLLGLNGIPARNQFVTINTDTPSGFIVTNNSTLKTITLSNLSPLSIEGVINSGGNIDLRGGKIIGGSPTYASNDLIVILGDNNNNWIDLSLNVDNVLSALQGLGTGQPFMRYGDNISLLTNNSGYVNSSSLSSTLSGYATTGYVTSNFATIGHSHGGGGGGGTHPTGQVLPFGGSGCSLTPGDSAIILTAVNFSVPGSTNIGYVISGGSTAFGPAGSTGFVNISNETFNGCLVENHANGGSSGWFAIKGNVSIPN